MNFQQEQLVIKFSYFFITLDEQLIDLDLFRVETCKVGGLIKDVCDVSFWGNAKCPKDAMRPAKQV